MCWHWDTLARNPICRQLQRILSELAPLPFGGSEANKANYVVQLPEGPLIGCLPLWEHHSCVYSGSLTCSLWFPESWYGLLDPPHRTVLFGWLGLSMYGLVTCMPYCNVLHNNPPGPPVLQRRWCHSWHMDVQRREVILLKSWFSMFTSGWTVFEPRITIVGLHSSLKTPWNRKRRWHFGVLRSIISQRQWGPVQYTCCLWWNYLIFFKRVQTAVTVVRP